MKVSHVWYSSWKLQGSYAVQLKIIIENLSLIGIAASKRIDLKNNLSHTLDKISALAYCYEDIWKVNRARGAIFLW